MAGWVLPVVDRPHASRRYDSAKVINERRQLMSENMGYAIYSTAGRAYGMKDDLTWSRIASDRTTSGTTKPVTREAYAQRSPRFERTGSASVWLSMTIHSKTTAHGFAKL